MFQQKLKPSGIGRLSVMCSGIWVQARFGGQARKWYWKFIKKGLIFMKLQAIWGDSCQCWVQSIAFWFDTLNPSQEDALIPSPTPTGTFTTLFPPEQTWQTQWWNPSSSLASTSTHGGSSTAVSLPKGNQQTYLHVNHQPSHLVFGVQEQDGLQPAEKAFSLALKILPFEKVFRECV